MSVFIRNPTSFFQGLNTSQEHSEILIKEISIEVEWAITTKFYEHPKKEAMALVKKPKGFPKRKKPGEITSKSRAELKWKSFPKNRRKELGASCEPGN